MTTRLLERQAQVQRRPLPGLGVKRFWAAFRDQHRERKKQAQERQLLADMDARMLQDIGLTEADVWRMSRNGKPRGSGTGSRAAAPVEGMPGSILVSMPAAGIGMIRLHRPEQRNALSIAMREEICACLDRWKEEPGIEVVIISGSGPAFSAGFDLREFQQPELAARLYASSSRFHRTLWNFPKVLVAAVNGPAVGGGFDLATLCDLRLCAESAFFAHQEIKLGVPPLFTPLRRIVGDGVARELCLTGRQLGAVEARQLGLVSALVPAGELEDRALQLAGSLLDAPGEALRFAKSFFRGGPDRSDDGWLDYQHDQVFERFIPRVAQRLADRQIFRGMPQQ